MTHKIAIPASKQPSQTSQEASPLVRTFGAPLFRTDGDVLALTFSPAGALWSLEGPGVLRQWDPATGKALKSAFLSDLETLWAFSEDGNLIASGSDEIVLWDVASGDMVTLLEQPSWVTALN